MRQDSRDNQQEITAQDMEMISLVLDVALHNGDVRAAYPHFYQRMQENEALAQAFQDLLTTARDDSPLPASLPPANLDFLERRISRPPLVTQEAPNRWQAAWHLLTAVLTQRFTPAWGTMRTAAAALEETSTLLLFNEFEVDDQRWQATLEAGTQIENPGNLELFLSVTGDAEPLPPLQATLQWGPYRETAVLNRFGQAHFPPIPIAQIINEQRDAFRHDLHLSVTFG